MAKSNAYINLIIESRVNAYSTGHISAELEDGNLLSLELPDAKASRNPYTFAESSRTSFSNLYWNSHDPDPEALFGTRIVGWKMGTNDNGVFTRSKIICSGEEGAVLSNGGSYTITITAYNEDNGSGSEDSGGSDTPGENPDSGGGSETVDTVKINLTINSEVEAYSNGEVMLGIGSALPYIRIYLPKPSDNDNICFTINSPYNFDDQVCYTYDTVSNKKEPITTDSPLLNNKTIQSCNFTSWGINGAQTDLIQCAIEGENGKFVKNGNYIITITGYTGPAGGGSGGGDTPYTPDIPDTPSEEDTDNADKVAIKVPVIKGTINSKFVQAMKDLGYVKARAVVVYPGPQDRKVLCQGVATPALYTEAHRGEATTDKNLRDLYAQSSWFFRPTWLSGYNIGNDANSPSYADDTYIKYMNRDGDPEEIKMVEIQGHYDDVNKFKVDWKTLTFHSPDVELDNSLINQDYTASNLSFTKVGDVEFKKTFSDIEIQTETPAISSRGSGFVKKSFTKRSSKGIISGLFWDDYIVDDNLSDQDKNGKERDNSRTNWFEAYSRQKDSAKWMVYLWNKGGSLNNDIARPAECGVQSAILKKKIVSNFRISNTLFQEEAITFKYVPYLYNLDTPSIIKLKTGNDSLSNVYQGNIDTLVIPDERDGMYFSLYYMSFEHDSKTYELTSGNANFTDSINKKTYAEEADGESIQEDTWGIYEHDTISHSGWYHPSGKFFKDVGNNYHDLVLKKEGVRMKYKSTPHLVMVHSEGDPIIQSVAENSLPMMELKRSFDNEEDILFGGRSQDALRENTWIPCGEPVRLDDSSKLDEYGNLHYEYSWGDTYFQRWDCLKTYAFTPEDINQVVEIGSFMLETHTNIDGRYDRNRGQSSNLYMSPQNFNLINPAYSQLNNFFSYKIKNKDSYSRTKYENQIVWSKTKTSGADVDLWTNVTLSSPLELDGDKGPINKLARYNDQLIAFQNRGTAQILYNENVQISTEQGVPIELANSGKVQGKRYISDSIGCVNKWSVCTTPMGIYFMDSVDKNIYLFNGQLNNVSSSLGMNSWVKQNIPPSSVHWAPYKLDDGSGDGFLNFVTYNDRLNQDVLFINGDTALAYSEKLAAFTSFYDYGHTPYFCNFVDGGVWIRNDEIEGQPTMSMHGHQQGDYCSFFGVNKPFWTILVSNPEPQADKIFTNLEFRACVEGDGELDSETGKFTPTLPFDTLETWNEYQRGAAFLTHRNGHSAMLHHTLDNIGSLKRKFRIWRCDIPRDNGNTINIWDDSFDDKFLNPERRRHPNDRMRNPWLYVKLLKKASEEEALKRTEIHDLLMTYFA